MIADRIASLIDRRFQNHKVGWPSLDRGERLAVRGDARHGSAAQDELDDDARWLDGQVQGWAASHTV
jgi:hypothetical protein